jgi:hypothetical protein
MVAFEGYPLAATLLAIFELYLVASLLYTVVYNVFFHPLAHIPGPKISGATNMYQTYLSLVGGSRYYIQIKRLHKIYGKIPKPLNLLIF